MTEEDEGKPQPFYDDDEQQGRSYRWMSTVVVVLAVAGFFGLAWYAYRNGGETVDEKDVELIKADTTPVKEAPANPGGMQIPNQDKTVYGLISGQTQPQVVERILPTPEEPMARAAGKDNTKTWMSDSAKGGNEAAPEAVNASPSAGAAAQETPSPSPKEQFNPERVVAQAAPVQNVDTTSLPAPSAKAPVQAAPPAAPEQQADAEEEKPAPAPAPKPAKKAKVAEQEDNDDSSSADEEEAKPAPKKEHSEKGSARAQLGAYRSEDEAESNWKRLSHAHSILGSKQHYIVRADLGDKGIYYRLQVGPFASKDSAENFCHKLGGQCFPAKGK